MHWLKAVVRPAPAMYVTATQTNVVQLLEFHELLHGTMPPATVPAAAPQEISLGR